MKIQRENVCTHTEADRHIEADRFSRRDEQKYHHSQLYWTMFTV
jgi:hypothetical protein